MVPAGVWAQERPQVQEQRAPSPALQVAVEEFRVQTAGLTPATGGGSGGRGGGFRTGGRQAPVAWHGRLYHNFRNNVLDAIPHQIVQRGQPQRKLRRNQFGFNVTGPVILPKIYDGRGRTFFTVSFEGMRESIGQTQLNTIPTTLERTGSWSHVVDFAGNPLPIYDPLTTSLNPDFDPSQPVTRDNLQYNRLQFPNNVIPVTQLDPVALAALQYYPQPNTSAGPYYRNNYFVVSQEVNRANGFIATVDHSFLDKHRITVRMNRSVGIQGRAAVFPTLANPQNPPVDASSRGLRVEHIFTASAANINTLRLQVDSNVNENQPMLDDAGRPFPRYQIDGYQNMGTQNPVTRNAQHTYQLTDTFATRFKTHRLSVGLDLQHIQINSFQPQYPEGRFNFTAGYTSLPGIINTGHGFASFLLGAAAEAQINLVTAPSYFRWSRNRVTFSDQWQMKPSLTVTFGANLEIDTQRVEKYNRQSNISLNEINPANGLPGALVAAGEGGYGRSFPPNWTKVSPSLGIAWSVLGDNDTVLRLNYERNYGQPRTNSFQFGTQAFNGNLTFQSANAQISPAVVLGDGLPINQTYPDLRPDAVNGTVVQVFNTTNAQPMQQSFTFSLQRQLAPFLILTAEYTYQNGRNQYVNRQAANPNAVPLGALKYDTQLNDLNFRNSLRRYPQYLDFDAANMWPAGRQLTKSFKLQLEKRTSGGLAINVSYQYRTRYDNYSQNIQNVFDLNSEWSFASFGGGNGGGGGGGGNFNGGGGNFNGGNNNNFRNNGGNQLSPQQVSFNYIYELPFGAGKTFLTSGWMSAAMGNWAISGVGNIYGGRPLTLSAQFNNTGGVVPSLRADLVPGVDPHVENPGPEGWFNPAAFVQPADFSIGNSPRTIFDLRGPGGWNTDMTLNKRIPIGADRTLEFMVSMFNAFNHANWDDPDTSIGPASAPNANAGRSNSSSGGRIVQLGLRINF